MIRKFDKNYKLLSIISLSNIEKYLQEIVNLSFEYASLFILNYSLSDFKQIPINLNFKKVNNSNFNFCFFNFINLLNTYLEKDHFFTNIYFYLNLKFKIKYNQFIQLMFMRGNSSLKNFDCKLLSSLNHGLTFKNFILASFRARESIIDSSVNISSSGYLTRKLIESLRNTNIKEIKCDTKYKCKNYITDKYFNVPLLCYSSKSICSFCLNVFYNYNMFIGYNKGIIAGQALGEPSTQMLLRTFHLGGTFGGFDSVSYTKTEKNVACSLATNTVNIPIFGYLNYDTCKNYCEFYNTTNFVKFTLYNCLFDLFNCINIKFINLFKNFKNLWCFYVFYKKITSSNKNLENKKVVNTLKNFKY